MIVFRADEDRLAYLGSTYGYGPVMMRDEASRCLHTHACSTMLSAIEMTIGLVIVMCIQTPRQLVFIRSRAAYATRT